VCETIGGVTRVKEVREMNDVAGRVGATWVLLEFFGERGALGWS